MGIFRIFGNISGADVARNRDTGTRKVSLPTGNAHISCFPFLVAHRSRRLLGLICTWNPFSVACFEANWAPPFWNVGRGWNCSDVSNLLPGDFPDPFLISGRDCLCTDFCTVLLSVLPLLTTFPWLPPPWQGSSFRTGRFGNFVW